MRLNDWKLWTVLAVVLFLGGLGYYYFRPVVEEGVVAATAITGERNNVAYTIISFHELGVNPKIDDWESLFPNTTKISEEAENQLKTRYTDLRYIINVKTKIKTMGYYASKEDFNKVDPGDGVKFRILRKRDPTIKIIKVRESHHAEDVSGVALGSRGPNGSESHFPEYIPGLIILIMGFSGLLLFCYRILNGLGLIFQREEEEEPEKGQRRVK